MVLKANISLGRLAVPMCRYICT